MAKVDNLSLVIKNKIKNYENKLDKSEQGKVLSISDGIAIVSGLEGTVSGELLKFPNGLMGMALNLDEDSIGVILLGAYSHVKEGDPVERTKKVVEVQVGDELLGRIVDPLGKAQDGKDQIKSKITRAIERVAPGVMTRQSVNQPLETGILSIDSMIPIGKGQRELIIGDRKTGKTAIAIDAIINQKGKNVNCVYVSIGQKNSTLANTTQKLIDSGAMEYTTIVIANASDSDAMQYLAPYTGITIAEEWMEKGKDVLIVFDDLTKHAVAYRALSLLLRRPPGREAYPGDVFYLHSKLLERAARLNKDFGGGSITALPIVETQAGDISAYIPTNIISITDGQIFLMTDMFNAGQRPAVDAGLSVSRVGSSAQTKLMKELSGSLKLIIANYNEVKSFAEFSSDLDEETKKILDKGKKIMELLRQPQYTPYQQFEQAFILFAIKNELIENIPVEKISTFKSEILKQIKVNKDFIEVAKFFDTEKKLTPEISTKLLTAMKNAINEFVKTHKH